MSLPPAGTIPAPAPGNRSERKQAAIVAAAAEVFLNTGYAGASMDEIAARSGVSKQTVYKHFTSKEALFIAVMGQMMGEADTAVHKALPQVQTRQGSKTQPAVPVRIAPCVVMRICPPCRQS